MKCQGCGHDYPSTLTRCTRCGQSNPKRGQIASRSRLIEFPQKPRQTKLENTKESTLPAWRAELNEKVRQVKARRNGSQAESDATGTPALAEVGHDGGKATIRQADQRPKTRTLPSRELSSSEAATPASGPTRISEGRSEGGAGLDLNLPSRPGAKPSNPIVEAALTRARKASENASRAALPRIEPGRPYQQNSRPALTLDKEATARALEPAEEITPRSNFATNPLPRLSDDVPLKREPEKSVEIKRPANVVGVHANVESPAADSQGELPEAAFLIPIEEIEPIDYLEAEIRKVDKVLNSEFVHNESPSLFSHFVIGAVDLLTVAVGSAPFIALVNIINGDFSQATTRIACGAIILLVTLFYLALTQFLCAKTFGMMITNTRLVDSRTYELPSAPRVLIRTLALLIALAPAMLGLLWIVVDRKRRGWHDFISGTLVVRDF